MVYEPINEHPWPEWNGWIVARWCDDYDRWIPCCTAMGREGAVRRLKLLRKESPDTQWRLVRETRTYTSEDD